VAYFADLTPYSYGPADGWDSRVASVRPVCRAELPGDHGRGRGSRHPGRLRDQGAWRRGDHLCSAFAGAHYMAEHSYLPPDGFIGAVRPHQVEV
jgi:hypothetical protein